MPASNVHPFLDCPGGLLAFAHRGGAHDFPENTMEAFEGAVNLGYRYIETDVHATSDGVLLAFHDDKLDRVTDKQGPIHQLTYDEVKQAKINGTHEIPRFEELLLAFSQIRINIDPKADTAVEPLVASLAAHDAFDRVCIGSFSDARLRHFRETFGTRICTSMGPLETARLRFGSWGLPTGQHLARCAQVPIKQSGIKIVDKRFCDHAHRKGLQAHVWTIDDPQTMEHLIRTGVDGIMTDSPGLLKTVLQAHNLWA
ncbi:MAG: glycerophosphodiester phosphodiesterase [Alphaproteobacteria bacterium]